MSRVLLALALAVALVGAATAVNPDAPFWYGHAAYTYGPLKCTPDACDVTPSCNHASFKDDISAFNQASSGNLDSINMVYSYGGDIEFWATKDQPDACWAPAEEPACNVSIFYDPINAEAAAIYSQADGVDGIVSLIDSRLDGWDMIKRYNDYDGCKFGNFYPNLVNLTTGEIHLLAEQTARLYCKDDVLSGVQIDLEPYQDPWLDTLDQYIQYTAAAMLDKDGTFGCKNQKWPEGRTLSYFTFAHRMTASFTSDILGPNGYYVFSGYDLFPKPIDGGFMYNNVTEFGQKLRYELNFIRPVIGTEGRFTLAVPIAASCHEYEQYKPMHGEGCGPACTPQTNIAQMHDYVSELFNVLLAPETTRALGGLLCLSKEKQSQFMGLSFWVWTHQMTYPPMKWFDNDFLPVQPSTTTIDILHQNLGKLSDGTTCITNEPSSCAADSGRPNGCTCEHKGECASNFCTGTCHDAPSTWMHTAPKAWTDMYGSPYEKPLFTTSGWHA